jgi:hypothetical protein
VSVRRVLPDSGQSLPQHADLVLEFEASLTDVSRLSTATRAPAEQLNPLPVPRLPARPAVRAKRS